MNQLCNCKDDKMVCNTTGCERCAHVRNKLNRPYQLCNFTSPRQFCNRIGCMRCKDYRDKYWGIGDMPINFEIDNKIESQNVAEVKASESSLYSIVDSMTCGMLSMCNLQTSQKNK